MPGVRGLRRTSTMSAITARRIWGLLSDWNAHRTNLTIRDANRDATRLQLLEPDRPETVHPRSSQHSPGCQVRKQTRWLLSVAPLSELSVARYGDVVSMGEALLPEFDFEMALTRSLLERMPDRQAAWKPDPASMTFGELAALIASLPSWAAPTLRQDAIDVASGPAPRSFESVVATLAAFDAAVKAARAAIRDVSDADAMTRCTLTRGDGVVQTMSRLAMLRVVVLSHLVHYRGQLSVYLRLHDIPLPSLYGPSADTLH
jgi:uncharacterized damage-inducible protein DinB